jgi:Ni,Fe-hydrogenase I large subunit
MAEKIIIDPVTRIEGHLAVEVEVEGGKVTDAKSMGMMFRGLELIMQGRDPQDAVHIMQRTCGV